MLPLTLMVVMWYYTTRAAIQVSQPNTVVLDDGVPF
jgi:hypothetical protein